MNQKHITDRVRAAMAAAASRIDLGADDPNRARRRAQQRSMRRRRSAAVGAVGIASIAMIVGVQQIAWPQSDSLRSSDVPAGVESDSDPVVVAGNTPGVAASGIPAALAEAPAFVWKVVEPDQAAAVNSVFSETPISTFPGFAVATAPGRSDDDVEQRIWRTEDGVSWAMTDLRSPFNSQFFFGATSSGSAIFAVGTAPGAVAGAPNPVQVAFSDDSTPDWTTLDLPVDDSVNRNLPDASAYMETSTIAVPDGVLVALTPTVSIDFDQLSRSGDTDFDLNRIVDTDVDGVTMNVPDCASSPVSTTIVPQPPSTVTDSGPDATIEDGVTSVVPRPTLPPLTTPAASTPPASTTLDTLASSTTGSVTASSTTSTSVVDESAAVAGSPPADAPTATDAMIDEPGFVSEGTYPADVPASTTVGTVPAGTSPVDGEPCDTVTVSYADLGVPPETLAALGAQQTRFFVARTDGTATEVESPSPGARIIRDATDGFLDADAQEARWNTPTPQPPADHVVYRFVDGAWTSTTVPDVNWVSTPARIGGRTFGFSWNDGGGVFTTLGDDGSLGAVDVRPLMRPNTSFNPDQGAATRDRFVSVVREWDDPIAAAGGVELTRDGVTVRQERSDGNRVFIDAATGERIPDSDITFTDDGSPIVPVGDRTVTFTYREIDDTFDAPIGNTPEEGTWTLVTTADGTAFTIESLADLAGVDESDIAYVPRISTNGNQVVVVVSLNDRNSDDSHRQIVLVGTPLG